MKTQKIVNSVKSSIEKAKQNFSTPRAVIVTIIVAGLAILGYYLSYHVFHVILERIYLYFKVDLLHSVSVNFLEFFGIYIESAPNIQINRGFTFRINYPEAEP
jgi:multisubunit Na+/H+ antiporter MnhB subunit